MRDLSPVFGEVVETLLLDPYDMMDVNDAVADCSLVDADLPRMFGNEWVSLSESTEIKIVEFPIQHLDCRCSLDKWADERGLMFINLAHVGAILLQHPDLQRRRQVVALNSKRYGRVLCLYGNAHHRGVTTCKVREVLDGPYVFGLVQKSLDFSDFLSFVPSLRDGTARMVR